MSVATLRKPLIYIDQNIIGLQLQGCIKLSKRDDAIWVYSKEHFAEIKRAQNPEKYLDVLGVLDAKLLELNLDGNFRITGQATLHETGCPYQHFDIYTKETNEVSLDDSIFDPIQVWVNGGACEDVLIDLPERFAQEVLNLTSGLSLGDFKMFDEVPSIRDDLDSMIVQMISNGNDIHKTRAALGDEKGSIGSIKGRNRIVQIWDKISSTTHLIDTSCDQFFGFEPVDKQGYEVWPMYLGIIGCNSVLDILGFQAEKKCRKLNKIQNVRSDAGHIAMGAYCSAILAEDTRLINRAKAIYEYKNIDTIPVLCSRKNDDESLN